MNDTSTIPDSFLSKLFDLTGSENGGNKGYLMFYVDKLGNISTIQKSEGGAISLALFRAAELYTKVEDFGHQEEIS